MNVGILKIGGGECVSDSNAIDTNRVSYELSKHGYFVRICVSISDPTKIQSMFSLLKSDCDAVLICGDYHAFFDVMRDRYDIARDISTFLLDDTPCAVSHDCNNDFVADVLIPMLNGLSKTYYATNVFRTIGKTEEQLRIILKDYIKNRNKISFKFVSDSPECAVLVRYSNKTQKNTVSELLSGVKNALKDCIYSYDDTSVAESVALALMNKGKTLGLAESFTGGNIAASLVKFAGISSAFKEGIVCYDNSVKNNRLRVSKHILDNYGAVSIETAYEMAANLITDGQYDYVVATTGNAGPTSEKPNEVGVCYIAVGDKRNIDIYPYKFDGNRQAVIKSGTQTALYHLLKRLQGDSAESSSNND